jgi:hypothetical protein
MSEKGRGGRGGATDIPSSLPLDKLVEKGNYFLHPEKEKA